MNWLKQKIGGFRVEDLSLSELRKLANKETDGRFPSMDATHPDGEVEVVVREEYAADAEIEFDSHDAAKAFFAEIILSDAE